MSAFSFSLFLMCFLLASSVSGSLYARDNQRRLYYTMYIPNGNHAAAIQVARQLEARYEGPVGELQQYHEISTLKSPSPYHHTLDKRQDDNDYTDAHHTIIKRFQQLQQQQQQQQIVRRDTTATAAAAVSFILQVDSLKPQIKHRRLVKRAPPSSDYQHHRRRQEKEDEDDDEDEEETEDHPATTTSTAIQHYLDPISSKDYLMNLTDGFKNLKQALKIDDPGFDRQWHLVRTKIA